MKENLNPKPNSLKEENQNSAANKSIAKNEESTYDLSDVGDAALLAVLSENQKTGTPDEKNPADKSTDKDGEDNQPGNDGEVQKEEKEDQKEEKEGKEDQDKKNGNEEDSEKEMEEESPAVEEIPEKMVNSLLALALKLLSGEMPEERLANLMNAASAVEAIEQARKEGEIAGRNAVIDERLVAPEVGAPDLIGSPAPNRNRKTSIFDLALDAR